MIHFGYAFECLLHSGKIHQVGLKPFDLTEQLFRLV
jgi:hypothetical protein